MDSRFLTPPTVRIAVITAGQPRSEFLVDLLNLSRHQPGPDDAIITAFDIQRHGPYLDMARTSCVEAAWNDNADVLMFIDDDIFNFTAADVSTLVNSMRDPSGAWAFPIVGGVYMNGQTDGTLAPMAYRWVEEPSKFQSQWNIEGTDWNILPISMTEVDATTDMIPVDALGTGFFAIHRGVLDAMARHFPAPMPWFQCGVHRGRYIGEDLAFCDRARQIGYHSYLNPNVRVSHMKVSALHAKPQEPEPEPQENP
jgi:hypothetical protein